ncbi:hypothetical protein [Streptomyces sp. NPDC057877]|uniref:hypothetical protein n=1 Tax=Streptomyces sp. NPDC057877 TaxID=3346269 RepID=UPI003694D48A
MSPLLSPDTKAIVRAAEALTVQVRRLADALTTPVTTAQTPRLLSCGLCYEEHGEEVHPHPECPIGSPTSALREQIAAALYERERPPRDPAWAEAHAADREVFVAMADAVLPVILPTTKLLGEIARSADAEVKRVIDLYERWVKAGPPPLGASMSRWWDARLLELRNAILPPEQDDEDQEQAEPPTDEEDGSLEDEPTPDRPNSRQPAYDAVYAYIRGLGEYLPPDLVNRNATIWHAVHAALNATPVGRCISAHCVEGDHILPVESAEGPS